MNLVAPMVQQRLLLRNQVRIVDTRRYARVGEMSAERLPSRGLAEDRKEVPRGSGSLGRGHKPDHSASDFRPVSARDLLPSTQPSREVWQKDLAKDRCVQLVETTVQAGLVVDIGRALPVVPESP